MAVALVVLLGVAGAVAASVLTDRWFRHPAKAARPANADAVVVLAGGNGERLQTGLELIEAGVSHTLVVSTGITWFLPGSEAVHAICDNPPTSFEVICVAALPDSTKGEALATQRLVAERGWKSVVMVTSTAHLARSRWWFERCVDAAVTGIEASADVYRADVVHEWGGAVKFFVFDRDCNP